MSQIHPLYPHLGTHAVLAGTFYAVGIRYGLAPQGLNQWMGAIALSSIVQTGYRFLEEETNARKHSTLLKFTFDLASLGVLFAGAHYAGATRKTALLSTVILHLGQAALTTLFLFPETYETLSFRSLYSSDNDTLPSFPEPASTALEEATQVQERMKDSPLKEKAGVLIALSRLRLASDQNAQYKEDKDLFSKKLNFYIYCYYLCGAALILNRKAILDEAFNLTKDQKEESACMIAIAYAYKKLGSQDDINRCLDRCNRKSNTVEHWIDYTLDPNKSRPAETESPAPLTGDSKHHMIQFESFLKSGKVDEAREATRKDFWNLYWRVEALCRVSEASLAY